MKPQVHAADRKPSEEPLPKHEKHEDSEEIREGNLDKTIEDSFPASDPPSSIPDPNHEDAA
jgi:hypothetical protein